MAFVNSKLHLRAGAPGDLTYTYDATADTMATVAAAGYFNNSDDDLNLTVDDLIWVQAGDGNMWLRVSALSSGSVTTQFAGGNLPVQTPATGTSAAFATEVFVGQYEIGTSISSASRFILPIPYPGAEMMFRKVDSGTAAFFVDAGGSATAALGTSIVYDSVGNRRFVMQQEGETFHVVGVSATRWRILNAVAIASVSGTTTLGAGATRFPGGT